MSHDDDDADIWYATVQPSAGHELRVLGCPPEYEVWCVRCGTPFNNQREWQAAPCSRTRKETS